VLFCCPVRIWGYFRSRNISGSRSTTTLYPADTSYGDIVLNPHLATQSDPRRPLCDQQIPFSNGHFRRLACEDFDSTCRTSSISTACMQLIDSCVFDQGKYQSLPCWNVKLAESFNSQFRHDRTSIQKTNTKTRNSRCKTQVLKSMATKAGRTTECGRLFASFVLSVSSVLSVLKAFCAPSFPAIPASPVP
jgi:hypothetical protein